MTQKKSQSKKSSLNPSLRRLIKKEDLGAYEEYYTLASTKAIRELLAKDLASRINVNVLASEKKDKYENPSWAEYQADSIGYRRALRELITLLTKE